MKDHFIHLSRRPSVQSIHPVMVYLFRRGGKNNGTEETVEYRRGGCSDKTLEIYQLN